MKQYMSEMSDRFLLLYLSYLLYCHYFPMVAATGPITTASAPVTSTTAVPTTNPTTMTAITPTTTVCGILFSIASSSATLAKRKPYICIWYTPNYTRAFLFVDDPISELEPDLSLPPILVSANTSRFPYTYGGGSRAAIRIARIVKEAVYLNEQDVLWYVFGDDDTVFFPENLAKTLSKYDPDLWYYIGSNSESLFANEWHSFEMAFGGGGFAISYSLANVLARVLDSCLMRYAHLYGGDDRIHACLVELGVELTHEPGFHQVDVQGNIFGLLVSHPLSPLVSLHHVDIVDPIFPGMSKSGALQHLFKAVEVDSPQIVQQSVCYDSANSLTVLVSWGYVVQVLEGIKYLRDLLPRRRIFIPLEWNKTSRQPYLSRYMFNAREYPKDPCKRPVAFFFESGFSEPLGGYMYYTRYNYGNCSESKAIQHLEHVAVYSQNSHGYIGDEIKILRRQCCDVLSSSLNHTMILNLRQCRKYELIRMHRQSFY